MPTAKAFASHISEIVLAFSYNFILAHMEILSYGNVVVKKRR
jgi:hypothetical protein